MNLTGKQRLRQIKVKARIIAARNLRKWLAGEIDILPAWNTDELIEREFDRIVEQASRP